jgi:hypothetical protein
MVGVGVDQTRVSSEIARCLGPAGATQVGRSGADHKVSRPMTDALVIFVLAFGLLLWAFGKLYQGLSNGYRHSLSNGRS